MLIIDDQASVCVTLKYLLELAGYRTILAESGQAALEVAETERIDGALIDVHMPVMNGFDTCLRLQAQARAGGRALRIWFMTGAFTRDLERRSSQIGAFGVFAKPFDHSVFFARLEEGFSSAVPSIPPSPAVGVTEVGSAVNQPP